MRREVRTILWVAACILVGLLGAVGAVRMFGDPLYRIGPVKVRLSISPDSEGKTVVNVPPLGRMTAETHNAPVRLTASVEEMNVNAVRSMLVKHSKASQILEETRAGADGAFRSFGLRLLLLSLFGGGLAAFVIVPKRRLIAALVGAVAGVGVVGAVTGAAALSFRPEAFANPQYEGALKSAPWMLKLVRQGFFKLDNLDVQLRAAAANVANLESQISEVAPMENSGRITPILVVSDLHNNTAAMRIASKLAETFDVAMVLDAGDLTDLGTPFERSMAAVMGEIRRPHVFVGGNHDSPQTFDVLRSLRNTRLPDEGLVKIAGITVLGQSDPSSLSGEKFVSTSAELKKSEKRLMERYRQLKTKPDIVIVHSPRVAKAFLGKAPIVINGDDHRLHVDQVKGTAWIDPGTSGASGIRYFKDGSSKDITAVVVYISRSPKVHAAAADLISIQSPKGEFTIQRKRFATQVAPAQKKKQVGGPRL